MPPRKPASPFPTLGRASGLAWNGGVKPKPPGEGLATTIGLGGPPDPAAGLAWTSAPPSPEPHPPTRLDRVDAEGDGPELIRPSGRVRMRRT